MFLLSLGFALSLSAGGAEVTYYHSDPLSSTQLVTNAKGKVVHQYSYRAFGESIASQESFPIFTETLFTGQTLDRETGLYQYGSRYYDPELARFIQADPVVPSLANPQSLNRYSYVLNNPLIYRDPSGNIPIIPSPFISTAISSLSKSLSDVFPPRNPQLWIPQGPDRDFPVIARDTKDIDFGDMEPVSSEIMNEKFSSLAITNNYRHRRSIYGAPIQVSIYDSADPGGLGSASGVHFREEALRTSSFVIGTDNFSLALNYLEALQTEGIIFSKISIHDHGREDYGQFIPSKEKNSMPLFSNDGEHLKRLGKLLQPSQGVLKLYGCSAGANRNFLKYYSKQSGVPVTAFTGSRSLGPRNPRWYWIDYPKTFLRNFSNGNWVTTYPNSP